MPQTTTWILGLIGLLVLTFLCVTLHAAEIEAGIVQRTAEAFVGLPEATVEVSGRDVTLRGTVPTALARADAEAVARTVPGVRRVHNDLQVIGGGEAVSRGPASGAGVSPFTLTEAGGALLVRGVVPNGAARMSVLTRVGEAYPTREVRDELTLEPGAQADWEGSLLALLPRLRGVNRPSLAIESGEASVFVLGGAVPTEDAKAEVEARARAAVASPYTLRSELLVEDPAIGDQLQASGSTDADVVAAEEALREALSIGQIQFASGTNDLAPASREILDRVAAVLVRYPVVGAEVQGHTDAQGADAANQALSQERAEVVEAYLLDQGVPTAALTPQGYGEAQPIASNDTAEGRARNRRVVFALRRL